MLIFVNNHILINYFSANYNTLVIQYIKITVKSEIHMAIMINMVITR